ncbi:acyltransferase, partial [Candidatus Dojkabacteria bacterium]|nr:acyltransferase [Candidatus Dojkabacteria bacterium]
MLLMVLTHAIAFFHIGDDQFVTTVGTFGGTVSFGLFLFISGVSAYFGYIRYAETEQIKLAQRRNKIFYRSITLLAGYYFVATIASIPSYDFPPNLGWITNITRTALFTNIPAFTEFIVPFIIFGLLLIPLRRVYKFILKYPPLAFAIGAGFFALGQVLYSIKIDGELIYLKSVLVGEGDWHRFPIFQYLIVYILGMAWGKFMEYTADESARNRIALISAAASGILLVASSVSFGYLQLSWLEPLFRWPPSITFLLVGIVTAYVLFFIVNITGYLKMLGPGQLVVNFMGIKAFDFFIAHTLILFIYKYITGDQHYESAIVVGVLYVALLVLSAIVIALKDWLIEILQADSEDTEGFGWLFSERVAVTAIWVVLILLAGMGIIQGNAVEASSSGEDVSFKKRLIREEDWPYWWDHNYNFYQEITITNPDGSLPIYRNTWFSFNFDHAAAIAAGRAMASAADLRVVFYSDENGFIELPFVLEGIGGNATIKFKLQDEVFAGNADDRYFLYYGDPGNAAYPASQENPATTRTEGLSVGAVTAHKITGNTNRKWLLKQGDRVLEYSTLLYTVQLDGSVSADSIVSYSIEGSNLRGMMDDLGGGKFQAAINIKELDIGTHKIQAVAREKENKLKVIESGFTQFYVSYPLYVVWSQDWEGWDV